MHNHVHATKNIMYMLSSSSARTRRGKLVHRHYVHDVRVLERVVEKIVEKIVPVDRVVERRVEVPVKDAGMVEAEQVSGSITKDVKNLGSVKKILIRKNK